MARLPLSLSTGSSQSQYHTLQAGFSSRSQGLSGDASVSDTLCIPWRVWAPQSYGEALGEAGDARRAPAGPQRPPLPILQTFRPIAKPAYSPTSWSSRSAVDLSSRRRLSTAHNGDGAFGAGGFGGAQPAAPMPARPLSFHERGGMGSRGDYDTLSLRSLRLGAGGLDDRYSVVSEQLEPPATSAYRAFAYERQASSSSSRAGALEWPETTEGPPSRTIRAPAMRTLQRFQSSHRSRGGSGGGPVGILEPVTRAPSVRSLSLSMADASHLPDVRGLDGYDSRRTLQRLSSG